MSWNKSPLSFRDAQELFEKALAAEVGIEVDCKSYGEAIRLRHRLNYYRKIDRIANKEVYPEDHPRHGTSEYDKFMLRVPPKGDPKEKTLYIEQRTAEIYQVREMKRSEG